MTDVLVDSYLAAVGAMTSGPRDLNKRAALEAADRDVTTDVTLGGLANHLVAASLNDPLRKGLHVAVSKWDIEDAIADWTGDTPSRTRERRLVIYTRLELDEATREVFDDLFPLETEHQVVISDEFEPWYTPDRRLRHELYWPAYAKYLLERRSLPVEAVNGLDDATTKVVERLSDPLRPEARQAKGLVVGYVQSGKTANFTGVLAKSIDAGYRLLIVLTGTVNLLREQTQRRIDMELVGKENILGGVDPLDPELIAHVDYQDDPDWERNFLDLGFRPSSHNYPDIIRLTTHRFDYKSLKAGIVALEFEKVDKTKPLFAVENLPSSSARVVIVKKNKAVLQKLVKDLKSIRTPRGEIPALIIDDESDQASVNTSDPRRWTADLPARNERTAINGLISELLTLLPRAQYVGYTATPFANVFIDPSDGEDVFPKDFLISLDRPTGYMGVREFHDIDAQLDPEDRTVANSQEKAYVRDLWDGPRREAELLGALDAFVVSGALKLYRERIDGLHFRHHTMLVHESVRVAEHAHLAAEIRSTWRDGGYTSPSGLARLRAVYETDFLPVSHARAGEYSFPDDFDDLKPFVGAAITKITASGDPVIIVNGDKDMAREEVDFDKRDVWRVLVGGTKLSRGFTIEGLTVSYYRRKTKQADTLMQMGRWFGFRRGYEDLVRLFIGRAEADGLGTIDLYEAFDAIVRDEEAFRDELRKYATLVDGHPQITPMEIPPLVSQHLPWLKPAAPNKMFNAELVMKKSPGSLVTPTGYPTDEPTKAQNYAAVLPILLAAVDREKLVVPEMQGVKRSTFDAWVGAIESRTVIEAISSIRWITDEYYKADIAFLREIQDDIDKWIVIAPQTEHLHELPGVGARAVFKRGMKKPYNKVWGEPTDPKHRPAALRIAGAEEGYDDPAVDALRGPQTAAVLIYPMCPDPAALSSAVEPSDVVLAVSWASPSSLRGRTPQTIQFRTRNKAQAKAAIVDLGN